MIWRNEKKRMDALERCVLQLHRERETFRQAAEGVQTLQVRLAALEARMERWEERTNGEDAEQGGEDRVTLSQILNEYLYGDGGDGKEDRHG